MWRQPANHSHSLRWEWKTAPWEFQTKLLHYFFLSNNKSNLHFTGQRPRRWCFYWFYTLQKTCIWQKNTSVNNPKKKHAYLCEKCSAAVDQQNTEMVSYIEKDGVAEIGPTAPERRRLSHKKSFAREFWRNHNILRIHIPEDMSSFSYTLQHNMYSCIIRALGPWFEEVLQTETTRNGNAKYSRLPVKMYDVSDLRDTGFEREKDLSTYTLKLGMYVNGHPSGNFDLALDQEQTQSQRKILVTKARLEAVHVVRHLRNADISQFILRLTVGLCHLLNRQHNTLLDDLEVVARDTYTTDIVSSLHKLKHMWSEKFYGPTVSKWKLQLSASD